MGFLSDRTGRLAARGCRVTREYRVATLGELAPGELLRVEAAGVGICLGRLSDGAVFALNDTCTHEEAELSDGCLDGNDVECPAHGSRFDLRTGAVRGGPARLPVASYPVRIESDSIVVEL